MMSDPPNSATDAATPFILRYGQDLLHKATAPYRYDSATQQGEILVDGKWCLAASRWGAGGRTTRITEVEGETTDDE